jgi:hypothetical protein
MEKHLKMENIFKMVMQACLSKYKSQLKVESAPERSI